MASLLLPVGLEALLGAPETDPQPLGGGITNRNFRVRYAGRDVVVRLAGKDTALLGIDRDCERRATAAAETAGVGPEVVAYLREPACLVTAFIAGRTLERSDVGRPDTIAEGAVALGGLHGGAPGPDRGGRGRAVGRPRGPADPQPLLGVGGHRPVRGHRRRARRERARRVRRSARVRAPHRGGDGPGAPRACPGALPQRPPAGE